MFSGSGNGNQPAMNEALSGLSVLIREGADMVGKVPGALLGIRDSLEQRKK